MNLIDSLLLGPHALSFLFSVVVVVVVVSTAGWLFALLCRKRSAPVRYGFLLCTLAIVVGTPVLVWFANTAQLGWLHVDLASSVAADLPSMPTDRRTVRPAIERSHPSNDAQYGESPFAAGSSTKSAGSEMPGNTSLADEAIAPDGSWWLIIGNLLAIVWATGSAIGLFLLLRGFVRLASFWREMKETASQGPRAAAHLASQVGLAKPPRVFVSARTASPVAIGLFSPAIVLPAGFEEENEPLQLDAALIHEMAHLARGDHWAGLGQRIAQTLFWWCPLIYAINRQLRRLREDICDNYVLRQQKDGRHFAELLVALADRVAGTPGLPASTGLFDAGEHDLEKRVKRLLSTETNTIVRTNLKTRLLVVVFGAALSAMAIIFTVRADEGTPLSTTDETPINGQLDSDRFAEREAASRELREADTQVIEALRREARKMLAEQPGGSKWPNNVGEIFAGAPGERWSMLVGVDGRTIRITENRSGAITVSVTEMVDGKEKTTNYAAKDKKELEEKHPEGFKIYKQHVDGSGFGGGDGFGGGGAFSIPDRVR
jgi:beta-lactamase regulating signal transducer with metallopeptidase domain